MTRKKLYLLIQSLLCAALAVWLAIAAIRMYVVGAASGGLFDYIYTREKVIAALRPMLPLAFLTLGMALAGGLLGVRDDGPVFARDVSPDPEKSVGQSGGGRLRLVVLALAAAMIVAGVLNGGLEDVLTKANAICMECVGLG